MYLNPPPAFIVFSIRGVRGLFYPRPWATSTPLLKAIDVIFFTSYPRPWATATPRLLKAMDFFIIFFDDDALLPLLLC